MLILSKNYKNWSHKKMITIPLTRNCAAAYYQNLEEVRGPLLQEKNQEHEKLQIFLKKIA